MICLEFRFLAGRFHATPWGRHANEGAIEWPPSPWRLCRALLATGFNRLGWAGPDDLPAAARSLIEKLASALPTYQLPPANGAHTRHYMPGNTFAAKTKDQKAKKELASLESTLTFDTFAQVGRDPTRDVLRACWPVDLDDAERALLAQLLEALPYLGRAESWVEARLATGVEPKCQCRLWTDDTDRTAHERVEVLAPMIAGDFTAWRAEQAARMEAQMKSEVRVKAEKKGKAITAKAWAKEEAKIDAAVAERLPVDVIAALCRSPTESADWNEPPGSRRVAYAVPRDALDAPSSKVSSLRMPRSTAERPTTAVFALTSDVLHGERLPLLGDVVLRTDALHKALVQRAIELAGSATGCLTGMTPDGREVLRDNHRHLHLLPLVLNRDVTRDRPNKAFLDHVLVHAEMGLDTSTLAALRNVRRTWANNLPDLFVTLAGLGDREDFQGDVPALASANEWTSFMPFVPPRFLKRRGANSLREQVLAELADRLLPEPTSMEVELEKGWLKLDTDAALAEFWARWRGASLSPAQRLSTRWRGFRLERPSFNRKPCVPMGFGLRLCFSELVHGPIALGYGAHFGLGLFHPAAADHP